MPPLSAVVSLLPVKLQDKAKAIVGLLGAVAFVVVPSLPHVPSWVNGVVAALTFLGVYAVPNVGYRDEAILGKAGASADILGKA